MNNPQQPNIRRVNVWDFFLVFGTLQQQTETQVEVKNFQGIYLSPQQAKALMSILQQNVSGYESTFGDIKLDPNGNCGPGTLDCSDGRRDDRRDRSAAQVSDSSVICAVLRRP